MRRDRLLLIVGLLAAAAYFYGLLADQYMLRLFTKPLPVLCLFAWLAPFPDADHRRIAMALALSAIGDLLLEFQPPFFVPGLVAFLGAQVVYIVAFTARDRRPQWLRAVPAALFGAGAYLWLAPSLGGLRGAVAAYIVAICVMLWRAWATVGGTHPQRLAAFAAVGATAFALSDILVAYNRFVAPVLALKVLLMVLYWTAQWLIAASVVRQSKD
ncbi:MAG: lysoplasmalogenase [Gammaproteobacteria bacterium]|jgi:alkenylglycerophosphocholine/alkenylglycerophosphoethanolamine hydrolase